jgi:hypothetical protein
MGISVTVAVSVPLTVLDAQGNGDVFDISVAPGRSAGELKIVFTADQLAVIAADGNTVYLTGSDFQRAANVLGQATQLAASAG